jgi:hypothetical protein
MLRVILHSSHPRSVAVNILCLTPFPIVGFARLMGLLESTGASGLVRSVALAGGVLMILGWGFLLYRIGENASYWTPAVHRGWRRAGWFAVVVLCLNCANIVLQVAITFVAVDEAMASGANMPVVGCPCGHIFSLRTTSEVEYSLIPEGDIEACIIEMNAHKIAVERLVEILDRNAFHVLVCPDCKRLLIERDKSGEYDVFQQTDRVLTGE